VRALPSSFRRVLTIGQPLTKYVFYLQRSKDAKRTMVYYSSPLPFAAQFICLIIDYTWRAWVYGLNDDGLPGAFAFEGLLDRVYIGDNLTTMESLASYNFKTLTNILFSRSLLLFLFFYFFIFLIYFYFYLIFFFF
jgi:hypothetical protein